MNTDPLSAASGLRPAPHRSWAPILQMLRVFWPCMIGMALARVNILVVGGTAYSQDDGASLVDGTNLMKCALFALFALYLYGRRSALSDRVVRRLALGSMVVQGLSVLLTAGLVSAQIAGAGPLLEVLSMTNSIMGSLLIFFWLRQARGMSVRMALVYVVGARTASELWLYAMGFAPYAVSLWITGIAGVAQVPLLLLLSRDRSGRLSAVLKQGIYSEIDQEGYRALWFGNTKLTAANTLCLFLMGLVVGALAGFATGGEVGLGLAGQSVCLLLTVGVLGILAAACMRRNPLDFSVFAWNAMTLLALGSIAGYAVFAAGTPWGFVFATALGAVFGVLKWFITIELMSEGKRDSYFYAIVVFVVTLLPRSIAGLGLTFGYEALGLMPGATATLLFFVLALVTMAVYRTLIATAVFMSSAGQADASVQPTVFDRVLDLEEGPSSFAQYRDATLRHNAREVGGVFCLTEREVDVLALYASGLTQKRIAEELDLAPSTVHSYIKSMYAKTGFHGRQDVLDYMRDYVS